MSHTGSTTYSSKHLLKKQIQTIAARAVDLIDKSDEQDPTIKLMAKIVVGDFNDLANGGEPHMTLSELIIKATQVSRKYHSKKEAWQHQCGYAMAERVLNLSSEIGMHKISTTKAVAQLNRIIRSREKSHAARTNGPIASIKAKRKASKQKAHRRNANNGQRRDTRRKAA